MNGTEWSAAALLRQLREQLVGVDGSLLRRAWHLVRRPGRAVSEALAATDDAFGAPLRLYLFSNLVFFLIGPSIGLMAFTLDSVAQAPGHADAVIAQIARLDIDTAVYRERFNSAMRFRQPAFVILMTLPIAGVAKAMARKEAFGRHLVLALLALAWMLLFWPAIRVAGAAVGSLGGAGVRSWADGATLILLILSTVVAMRSMWRAAVPPSRGAGWPGGLVLTVALLASLTAYGFAMFWLTFASLEWGL